MGFQKNYILKKGPTSVIETTTIKRQSTKIDAVLAAVLSVTNCGGPQARILLYLFVHTTHIDDSHILNWDDKKQKTAHLRIDQCRICGYKRKFNTHWIQIQPKEMSVLSLYRFF